MSFTADQRSKVVHRALGQLGKPYEFGAAGPDAYDCSGSTLDAWRPFLTLPHNAGEQLRAIHAGEIAGCRVAVAGRKSGGHWPRSLLQLGDLAWFYGEVDDPSSVQHVAVYVERADGKRWIVNATGPGRPIEKITLTQYATPLAYGFMGH